MLSLGVAGRASAALRSIVVGRVTLVDVDEDRQDFVRLVDRDAASVDCSGYAGVLMRAAEAPPQSPVPAVFGVGDRCAWATGDVVVLQPSGYVRTVYRIGSRHNALFATDRCNSYCLMCSQPPKVVDERGRVEELLRIVDLMSPDTVELGVTGGEPTLLGDGLIAVVARCKERLPGTALHVLSNGRLFCNAPLAERFAEVAHPDLMFGIPLYSDTDEQHDYVVQAKGAFDETVRGLLNLARSEIPVEIRVVVHRQTYARLFELAEFIHRNLTFAAHVAFMGLEPIGFAAANRDALWIDPWDYRLELQRAVLFLARRGMRVSIYNHQLCTLPEETWPFAIKSISDWKNEYAPVCEACDLRDQCCGFFSSSIPGHMARNVRAIRRS
jgi:His-Xaa-Ser system radical SAM maturase HxsC